MISYVVGKLAPNLTDSTKGLVKYVPGRGYFCAVPSHNGGKNVTSPPPSVVHSGDEVHQRVHDVFVHLEARVGYVYKGRKEDVEQEECKYAPFVKALFNCGVPIASDILWITPIHSIKPQPEMVFLVSGPVLYQQQWVWEKIGASSIGPW